MTAVQAEERGTAAAPPGRAVLCVPEDSLRPAITHALEASGFGVLAQVERGLELLPMVAEVAPDVVVLDIALAGTLGWRLAGLTKTLAPQVAIVVLSPLPTSHRAAVEAGALAVVPTDDLRHLREVLDELTVSPTG